LNPILFVLFFLSGAAGLVYELVWVRQLTVVFGGTTYAITTVLVVFWAVSVSAVILQDVVSSHQANGTRLRTPRDLHRMLRLLVRSSSDLQSRLSRASTPSPTSPWLPTVSALF
jgi:hypothetical protein